MAFLIHDEHGATNVGAGEVEALLKLGWRQSSLDGWFRLNGKSELASDGGRPKEATTERKKPGPKPKTRSE